MAARVLPTAQCAFQCPRSPPFWQSDRKEDAIAARQHMVARLFSAAKCTCECTFYGLRALAARTALRRSDASDDAIASRKHMVACLLSARKRNCKHKWPSATDSCGTARIANSS
mmetsp:Transcript_16353/g.50475  ORF Transcript_16353/g.50475 Transcript_16353/m.50475 type:complete len:114 (-) Transcript_16353:1847-2188(-)